MLSSAGFRWYHVKEHWVRESDGRVIYFHGGYSTGCDAGGSTRIGDPGEPLTLFTEADLPEIIEEQPPAPTAKELADADAADPSKLRVTYESEDGFTFGAFESDILGCWIAYMVAPGKIQADHVEQCESIADAVAYLKELMHDTAP